LSVAHLPDNGLHETIAGKPLAADSLPQANGLFLNLNVRCQAAGKAPVAEQ